MTRPSIPLRIAVWLVNAACWLPNRIIERFDARLNGESDE